MCFSEGFCLGFNRRGFRADFHNSKHKFKKFALKYGGGIRVFAAFSVKILMKFGMFGDSPRRFPLGNFCTLRVFNCVNTMNFVDRNW